MANKFALMSVPDNVADENRGGFWRCVLLHGPVGGWGPRSARGDRPSEASIRYAGHQHGHSLAELIGGFFYHQKYKLSISERNAASDPTM
jgi:hypothetical protein